jgi:homotetrameric cytidine deaminase
VRVAVPHRNVELKARDPEPERTLQAALDAGARDQGVLRQRDTYFAARAGRLKLREETAADGTTRAQLIAYDRPDEAAPRTSAYHLVDVADPTALTAALDAAHGISVVVDKRRRLLLADTVRIHLDEVDGLGAFVELEAVAGVGGPDLDLAREHAQVARLREVLDIPDDRITPRGYAALLLDAGAATDRLVDLAHRAMDHAYAPYSNFRVGAALRDETGALHSGANVENGAYPQGACAEASAIGALVTAGGTRIEEVAVMADTELITPCGGCRQRLSEFAGPDVRVHLCGPDGIRRTVTLAELLPYSFDLETAKA